MYRPLFDDIFFNDFLGFPEHSGKKQPDMIRADVMESADTYRIDLELPGYQKDEISIKLEDGYLTVTAAKAKRAEQAEEEPKFRYLRRELQTGTAARRFCVSKALTQEDIKARFANGILTLTLPKEDPKRAEAAKYISIE